MQFVASGELLEVDHRDNGVTWLCHNGADVVKVFFPAAMVPQLVGLEGGQVEILGRLVVHQSRRGPYVRFLGQRVSALAMCVAEAQRTA